MVRKHAFRALVVSFVLGFVESSSGDVFVPPGLNPGDTYHLAFVTNGSRNATSNSIADYNAFVQAEAARSGAFTETFGIDWFAIASTSATHARDNALVSAPVFLLNGAKVAHSFSNIWDGSLDTPLSIDQFLTSPNFVAVWTGTLPSGFASNLPLGTPGSIFSGFASASDSNWLAISTTTRPTSNAYHCYALSEELTAPAIPEPAAFFLVTAASVLTWLFPRQRQCERS